MLADQTSSFLAIDFDDGDEQKDISVSVGGLCGNTIPVCVEDHIPAMAATHGYSLQNRSLHLLARKFGTPYLTYTMPNRHLITFKSYDRFFPCQDTLPKSGLGNLDSTYSSAKRAEKIKTVSSSTKISSHIQTSRHFRPLEQDCRR